MEIGQETQPLKNIIKRKFIYYIAISEVEMNLQIHYYLVFTDNNSVVILKHSFTTFVLYYCTIRLIYWEITHFGYYNSVVLS